MVGSPAWDRVFSTASWIIVIALLVSVVTLLFQDPSGAGPVTRLLGVAGAKWFYIGISSIEGLTLAYAKFAKKKKLRKQALIAVYLTGLFTTILSLSISGLSLRVIDNIVLTLVAGGCWLYWKFKTEYINPEFFRADVDLIRDDLPCPIDKST